MRSDIPAHVTSYPTFEEIVAEKKLTQDSSFEAIAQAVITAHYLPPFPKKEPSRSGVNRRLHGGAHVSRTASNIELLLYLYEKFNPGLLRHPVTEDPLTAQDIKLLKLAALYHDSANNHDGKFTDEKAHAEKFRADMLALGYAEEAIIPFALAIQEKDNKENKSLFRKLIHDADCLEILRIYSPQYFRRKELDIVQDLKGCQAKDGVVFETVLENIIKEYAKTIKLFDDNNQDGIGKLHKECELAENCYSAVKNVMENSLSEEIVTVCSARGKTITPEKINTKSFNILDCYLRLDGPVVFQEIERLTTQSGEIKASLDPRQIEDLFKNGCLVRALGYGQFVAELKTLAENKKILAEHKLTTVAEIKEYITQQKTLTGKSRTPPGLKWRPSSVYRQGLPVQFAMRGGTAIIINPNSKGTLLAYFFKKNAESHRCQSGDFSYDDKTGSLKDKGGLIALLDKISEQESRRRGFLWDPAHKHWGRSRLSLNEVLGTYEASAIMGIVLLRLDEKSIQDALAMQRILGAPIRSLYYYTPEKGIQLFENLDKLSSSLSDQKLALTENDFLKQINSQLSASCSPFHLSEKYGDSVRTDIAGIEGEVSTQKRTLFCELSKIDDPKKEAQIRYAFYQLAKLRPKTAQEIENIVSVGINHACSDDAVTMSAIIECISEQDMEKFYLDLLRDFKLCLTCPFHHSGISIHQIEKDLLITLDVASLTEIHSSTSRHPLSSEYPLQYHFTCEHNQCGEIKCQAFVNKAGDSIMRFYVHNNEDPMIIEVPYPIEKIVISYLVIKIKKINEVLALDSRIQAGLAEQGILNLSLGHNTQASMFTIAFDVMDNKPQVKESFIKYFSSLLKIKDYSVLLDSSQDELKDEKVKKVSSKTVTLVTKDVQKIELFYNLLLDYIKIKTLPAFKYFLEYDSKKERKEGERLKHKVIDLIQSEINKLGGIFRYNRKIATKKQEALKRLKTQIEIAEKGMMLGTLIDIWLIKIGEDKQTNQFIIKKDRVTASPNTTTFLFIQKLKTHYEISPVALASLQDKLLLKIFHVVSRDVEQENRSLISIAGDILEIIVHYHPDKISIGQVLISIKNYCDKYLAKNLSFFAGTGSSSITSKFCHILSKLDADSPAGLQSASEQLNSLHLDLTSGSAPVVGISTAASNLLPARLVL